MDETKLVSAKALYNLLSCYVIPENVHKEIEKTLLQFNFEKFLTNHHPSHNNINFKLVSQALINKSYRSLFENGNLKVRLKKGAASKLKKKKLTAETNNASMGLVAMGTTNATETNASAETNATFKSLLTNHSATNHFQLYNCKSEIINKCVNIVVPVGPFVTNGYENCFDELCRLLNEILKRMSLDKNSLLPCPKSLMDMWYKNNNNIIFKLLPNTCDGRAKAKDLYGIKNKRAFEQTPLNVFYKADFHPTSIDPANDNRDMIVKFFIKSKYDALISTPTKTYKDQSPGLKIFLAQIHFVSSVQFIKEIQFHQSHQSYHQSYCQHHHQSHPQDCQVLSPILLANSLMDQLLLMVFSIKFDLAFINFMRDNFKLNYQPNILASVKMRDNYYFVLENGNLDISFVDRIKLSTKFIKQYNNFNLNEFFSKLYQIYLLYENNLINETSKMVQLPHNMLNHLLETGSKNFIIHVDYMEDLLNFLHILGY